MEAPENGPMTSSGELSLGEHIADSVAQAVALGDPNDL